MFIQVGSGSDTPQIIDCERLSDDEDIQARSIIATAFIYIRSEFKIFKYAYLLSASNGARVTA